ncbi:MAG: MMPL family transporter, partial [Alphaproteobacteria bacterium]|nr:MMPL family transporter [Alphaproteobacteria bacterium]
MSAGSLWERFVASLLGGVQRAPLLVLLAAGLITALAFRAILGLGFDTDTGDMIAKDARFMQVWSDMKARFPTRSDVLVVVIDGETPDQAVAAADRIVAGLAAEPALFAEPRRADGGPFLEKNGLLYAEREDLLDLYDSLADAAPLLQRLRADMSLRGLFAVVTRAGGVDADRVAWLLGRLARVIDVRLDGDAAALSWWEIMSGSEAMAADRRALVLVRLLARDPDAIFPLGDALDAARAIADDTRARVRLTGSPALERDELETAQTGAARAGLLSLVLVLVILWWALRSPRQMAAALITLIVGLVWTAGFAALAIGHLNLISIAFAVLFVSLAIDFSIHFCLQVSESGSVRGGALAVAGSLGLCAISTACGFYAFVFTDYRGIAELGVIAGSGMLIGLAANLTVLPALLTLWPGKAQPAPLRLPESGRRVRLVAAAVMAGSLAALPWLRFDANPLNLQSPQVESVSTLRDLMAKGERGLWQAASLAADWDQAAARAAAFEALDEVDKVDWLATLVPEDQAAQGEVIADMAFVLAPDPFAREWQPPAVAEQRAAAAALAEAIAGMETDEARALRAALARLERASDEALASVESGLLGALPARLAALDLALTAEPFGLEDVPEALVSPYRDDDGSLRLDIHPAEDVAADPEALSRFVSALRSVDGDVSD